MVMKSLLLFCHISLDTSLQALVDSSGAVSFPPATIFQRNWNKRLNINMISSLKWYLELNNKVKYMKRKGKKSCAPMAELQLLLVMRDPTQSSLFSSTKV